MDNYHAEAIGYYLTHKESLKNP